MSDLQTLIRQARRQGWSIEQRHGGHLAWHPPHGHTVIFSAASPSDWRAQANLGARLRKAGLNLHGANTNG